MSEIFKKIVFAFLFITLAIPSGLFERPESNNQEKINFTTPQQSVYVINVPASNFVHAVREVVNFAKIECNLNLTSDRSLQGSPGFNLNQPASCFNALQVSVSASPELSLQVFNSQAERTQQVVVLNKSQIQNQKHINSPSKQRTEVIEISFLAFYFLNIFSFANKFKLTNLKKILQSQNFFVSRQLLVLRC